MRILHKKASSGALETARSSQNYQSTLEVIAQPSLIRYNASSPENSIKLLFLQLVSQILFTSMKCLEPRSNSQSVELPNLTDFHMLSTVSIPTVKLYQEVPVKRLHYKKLEEMRPSED